MTGDFFYKPQKEKILSEAGKGLFDRSRQKSSRSKADLFELLLVKELNLYYVFFDKKLEEEINKLVNKVMTFKDGAKRIVEQKERVKLLFPFLIKEIDKIVRKEGKPTKIEWIGRRWQTRKSLSDIEIEFLSGNKIGISTKSTRSGKGTQKNIGLKELKRFLGLDIDKELLEMKNKIIAKVASQNKELKEISKKGMTVVRKNKYKFPVIQKIGKEYGIPTQRLAVRKSVRLFNKLPIDGKKEYVNFILGFKKEETLLNAFISGKQSYVYWNKSLKNLIGNDLKAIEEGNKGY